MTNAVGVADAFLEAKVLLALKTLAFGIPEHAF